MEFTLIIDIQPELQLKLKEALENFCSDNFIQQPVLKQCNVMSRFSRHELIQLINDVVESKQTLGAEDIADAIIAAKL